MNENILVINVHSSNNLGDAALLDMTLTQLRANFPSANITIAMDDPNSHKGSDKTVESLISWVHPRQGDRTVRWDYARLFMLLPATLIPLFTQKFFRKPIYLFTPKKLKLTMFAYSQADLVISGPGGFIYSSGRGLSLLITLLTIGLAILNRKPVYIFPQSIGPLKRAWEKKLVRWMLNKARLVMIREPISLRLVQEIGVDQSRVHLIPDLAFAMQKSDKEIGRDWLIKSGVPLDPDVPLLGMTIINWGEQHAGFDFQREYEEACGAAIKWFIENTNGKTILFPQVLGPYKSQDDRVPARRVVDSIPEHSASILVVEEPLPIAVLKSVYGWMDIFIGTRMHSNIFALTEGVPVIMIGYLPKSRGMAEMLGISQWCIDIRDAHGSALVDLLRSLWEKKRYWNDETKRNFDTLVAETTGVGKLVEQDYSAISRGNR